MRIDLRNNARRPLPLRVALRLIERVVGMAPGPLLAISYHWRMVHPRFRGYITRGMHGSGPWSKGEAELLASFVSGLNACRF